MREQHPELDLRREPPRRRRPVASAALAGAVTRESGAGSGRLDYAGLGTIGLAIALVVDPVYLITPIAGGLLAAFAYDLVVRPPAAETPVTGPPQGATGDIQGSEALLR